MKPSTSDKADIRTRDKPKSRTDNKVTHEQWSHLQAIKQTYGPGTNFHSHVRTIKPSTSHKAKIRTRDKLELLINTWADAERPPDVVPKPRGGALDVLVVLGAVELVVVRHEAVVEVVKPRAADGAHEALLVEHVVLHCHALEDGHAPAAPVAAVWSDHWGVPLLQEEQKDLHTAWRHIASVWPGHDCGTRWPDHWGTPLLYRVRS